MNRNTDHRNIASCLMKREHGILSINHRRAVQRFGEDLTAYQTHSTTECRLPGSPRSTFLVAFSPDRQVLASTHGDHTVRIIDGKTGRCMDTLEGHPRTPWSIAFHPSQGNLLASGCLGGEVRVWDLKRKFSGPAIYRSPESTVITSLAFHPTDMVLLVATSNQLLFWNWDEPTPFASIDTPGKGEKLRLVKFDPLGHHILTGIRNIGEESVLCRIRHQNIEGNFETGSRQADSSGGERLPGVHVARFHFVIERPGENESDRPSNNAENLHVISRDRISRGLIARLPRLQQSTVSGSTSTQHGPNRNISSLHPRQASDIGTTTRNLIEQQISATINHSIANVLAESGDIFMASNITNTTYRLQWWDFTKLNMPRLSEAPSNVIVGRCKLHNDASTDISADCRLLCVLVPSGNGFTESISICVFSLQSYNLGQCLFSSKFGPNAISVSFSPLGRYLLVGLATKNFHVTVLPAQQLVAQVFKFSSPQDGTSKEEEGSMEHILDLNYQYQYPHITCRPMKNVSTNAAFWHPVVGSGLVYGTNKGELQFCRIEPKKLTTNYSR